MKNPLLAGLLSIVLVLSGCAGPSGGGAPTPIQQGRIEQITSVPLDHPHQLGVGAIVGSLAGAGLGSLIGAGTGKDVAIAVGAIAGAVGGNYAENKYEKKQEGQQIVVRLDSGVLVVVTQATNPALRVGQPVYVQGSGSSATVQPR
jgi:outer membrane lipoprotein SlyB